jgi:hypothetical protein
MLFYMAFETWLWLAAVSSLVGTMAAHLGVVAAIERARNPSELPLASTAFHCGFGFCSATDASVA